MGRKADPNIRERILKEAEHLIHLRGFNRTSLEDIAKSCKMTKANLFHHYGSKEELGLAVLDDRMAAYRNSRVTPLCGEGKPAEAVRKMFTDAAKFFDGNGCRGGCFVGNIALEMSDINETFRKKVSQFFAEWTQGVAECLSCAQKSGSLDENLKPRAAAEAIVSLYEGAIMLARTTRDASVFKRVGTVAQSILEQHTTVQKGGK